MSNATRGQADAMTNSYVVEVKGKEIKITPSYWQPGYTPAYKATQVEALEFYLRKLKDERHENQLQQVAVSRAISQLKSGENIE